MMRRTFSFLSAVTLAIAIATVSAAVAAGPETAKLPPPNRLRTVFFTYHAEIPSISSTAHKLSVWIPLPRENAHQQVSNLSIRSNLKHRIVNLPRFGNRAVYFYASSPLPKSATMTISFDAVRHQMAADMTRAARLLPEPTGGAFKPFLSADRMIPITGQIAKIADTLGPRSGEPLQEAHAIYQYVTSTMTYVHSGKGVGHGSAIFACDLHHGNCTDFHSLFIGLARARGIPARFIIGVPLADSASGTTTSYHCWAEFYAGRTWVPIDAAAANEMPSRHDYYFGHLDADRIGFTMGRDLELTPRQHGGPLNYFIYPYAELDGKKMPEREIKTTFTYHDLSMSD